MTEGEYPKAESGRPFRQEENKEFVTLFNEQKFRPRTAILKVWLKYPTNMFLNPYQLKIKSPLRLEQERRKLALKSDSEMELRNKYKKEGDMVASNCMKLLGNSLYGKSIQKDRNTSLHLWNEETFRRNYDKHVKKYDKLNETQYIVEINEEEKEFVPPKDFTRLTPTHLGTFILCHSKRIMNNFIHVIDGFYKPEIYYTDTDSLYISSSNWDELNEAGLVSENEYRKGKNDYGDGGIIFGLYLAPKIKYNIILTSEGVLKEIKTFKGYSN
ncbi:hypothetical protein LOTGIDRAFT_154823 [Lottia gigantea]|uniref:DNA-directed DNA polymerase n=1 Tax=Lottia gigantea TaxID=225164 RepID=V4A215_LOTGI|nr:hypothetical protein LOTGIDRAFT_154823 [Lottia gigantea]ESO87326.1 hypothetical protein LOTGIDRAFT_154823 [Lottia gigantea]